MIKIDFTDRKTIARMGYLTPDQSQGFYLHLSLAMTPERNCLGVVSAETIARPALGSPYEKGRDQKLIEEKESYCRIKSYQAAQEYVWTPSARQEIGWLG